MARVGRLLTRASPQPDGSLPRRRPRLALALLLAAASCGGSTPGDAGTDRPAWADAPVPAAHTPGARLFETHCASCHGLAATGTEQGPPLVHSVYRPAHHADIAFRLAVTNGVRAHHWRFGDMPPVPGFDEEQVDRVIGYIRWLQREAGIR